MILKMELFYVVKAEGDTDKVQYICGPFGQYFDAVEARRLRQINEVVNHDYRITTQIVEVME